MIYIHLCAGVFLQMFLNLRILHTLGTDAVAHNQIQVSHPNQLSRASSNLEADSRASLLCPLFRSAPSSASRSCSPSSASSKPLP